MSEGISYKYYGAGDGYPKKRVRKSNPPKLPKVGQKIYVDTRICRNSSCEVLGGLATVSKVVVFVEVGENPGHFYNWNMILRKEQEVLKKQFGKKSAKPEPEKQCISKT